MAEAGLNLTANAATVTTGDLADNTDGKLIWVVNNGGTAATTASVAPLKTNLPWSTLFMGRGIKTASPYLFHAP